jgi:serine/threonine protein kinase/WD40 repeat protein
MTPSGPANSGPCPPPAGASFAELLGQADGLSGFDLAGLARADQRRRWQRGEPVPAEAYLDALARLAACPEAAVDLIYSEFVLSEELGQAAGPDEFLARFPAHAEALRRQFTLHAALAELGPDSDFSPGPSTDLGAPVPEVSVTKVQSGEPPPPADVVTEDDVPAIPGYEILDRLGEGGMGVVYKARHRGLNRVVALKVIKAAYAIGSGRARFQAEAEAVARLQHPNIVQVFSVGACRGRPFCALEFVNGGSLDRALKQALPTPAAAAWLIEQLARAVAAVHALHLVHRDLKPANILLQKRETTEHAEHAEKEDNKTEERRGPAPSAEARGRPTVGPLLSSSVCSVVPSCIPKIADFGLAKFLDGSAPELTQAGQVLGTPSYMAPEQASGRNEDVAAAVDVWALGAILYECLTGRPPFRGATGTETLAQVREQEPVPPRRLQPRCPRDLETVCLKCLEKEPGRRYASAADLADDLQRFREGRPIRARAVGPLGRGWRWCRRQPVAAGLAALAAAALLGLLGAAFWFSVRIGEARGETAAAREVAATQEYYARLTRARELTARRRPGWTWAALDDLAHAAGLDTVARNPADLRSEAAACLAGIDLRPGPELARDFAGARLAFHPDGRWLAVGQLKAQAWLACSVLLVPPDGGPGRTLHFPPCMKFQAASGVQDGTRALAVSPDGRWLVVGARSGLLHRWDLCRAPPALASWPAHRDVINRLAFAPDGRALFSASVDGTVKRWDVAAGAKGAVTFTAAGPVRDLAVSPSGDWLAYADAGQVGLLDCAALRPRRPALPGGASCLAASPDGHTLAVGRDDSVHLLDVESGRTLAALGPDDQGLDTLTFSPDGALLAGTAPQTEHVKVWEVAGGRRVADLAAGAGPVRAAFHPDGRRLAVLAGDRTVLYEVGGLREQTPVAGQGQPVHAFAPTPDGRSLAAVYGPGKEGGARVGLWPLDGRALRPTASAPLGCLPLRHNPVVAVHPEGKWLAVGATDRLTVFHPAGGTPVLRKELADVNALRFGPDGRLWAAAGCRVLAYELPEGRQVACWDNAFSETLTGLSAVWGLAVGKRWVLAGGRDGTLRLLRAADGRREASWSVSTSPIHSVALSADETLAAVGTGKGEVRLLRLPDGLVLSEGCPHGDSVEAVAFAGARLATGSRDRTVKLWDCGPGGTTEYLTFRTAGPVRSLAFTPCGAELAVLLERERAVRVWHLDRLRERFAQLGIE